MIRGLHRLRVIQQGWSIATAVVEVLRLESSRVLETKGSEFDPSRYNGLIQGILGQSS